MSMSVKITAMEARGMAARIEARRHVRAMVAQGRAHEGLAENLLLMGIDLRRGPVHIVSVLGERIQKKNISH
jgi:hypothetical protein